jgi:hypothetical protein
VSDSIQHVSDEVSIVIYDAPLPPKYFRLKKKFVRSLFVVTPLFILALITGLFLWGLTNRLKDAPRPKLPEVISESDRRIHELEIELKNLTESNTQLQNKLTNSAPSTPTATEDPFLMLIKRPYGMQNLLTQNKVGLEQINLVQEAGKASLKFSIISSNPETKVSGHILVFMMSETGSMVYPAAANAEMPAGIKYSAGEPFSVSRLRPTNAEFAQKLPASGAKFKIYIFSREGDLLLIKETENYKAGEK